ncbi:hypothetical protein AB0H03_08430 [Streptomyces sparsogenes]
MDAVRAFAAGAGIPHASTDFDDAIETAEKPGDAGPYASSSTGSAPARAMCGGCCGRGAFSDAPGRAGEIGPGDPYYAELHGGAQGWAPDTAREEEAHA